MKPLIIILGIAGVSACADPPPPLGDHFHGPLQGRRIGMPGGLDYPVEHLRGEDIEYQRGLR